MKRPGTLKAALAAALLLVLAGIPWLFSPQTTSPKTQNEHTNPGGHQEWFDDKKNEDGIIPVGLRQSWQAADMAMAQARTSTINPVLSATELGPFNVGGRTRALLYDSSDLNRIYAGAASGGLWLSTDNGSSWTAYDDQAVSLSVTSITQSPFDSDILYYGTGEANGSNFPGEGVFKSTDGGVSFQHLANTASLPGIGRIYKIEHATDPAKSTTVYVGTQFGGCYRTTNGGTNWQQIHSTGRIQDIVALPDGKVLLAVRGSGIFWSPDGSPGSFNLANNVPYPTGGFRRIEIANCASSPNTIYGLFEGPGGTGSDNAVAVVKTTNGGLNWTLLPSTPDLAKGQGSYCWMLGVNPNDPNKIVAGGVKARISFNGGVSWSNMSGGHADYHAFSMHPSRSNTFLMGNDGGVYRVNWNNPTNSPTNLNVGYSVTQFVGGGPAPTGQAIIGGTQDNGTWKTDGSSESRLAGNDGGYAYVHQQVPNIAYRSWQGFPSTDGPILRLSNFTSANPNSGTRINNDATMNAEEYRFYNYYTINPADGDQLYSRTNKALWRTIDRGTNWDRITAGNIDWIRTVGMSVEDDPTLYVAGTSSNIFRIDGAKTSTSGDEEVVPNAPLGSAHNFSSVLVHPQSNDVIYASYGNISTQPRLYRVTDALGPNPAWANISGNLPVNLPVNSVAVHPLAPDDVIFAATDYGLYVTCDGGTNWNKELRIPNVDIRELKLRGSDLKLFVFTYGRGVWMLDLLDCDPITSFAYSESFEAPASSGWIQGSADDFDWSSGIGGTPTTGTGPTVAAHGSRYLLAEATGNSPNQTADFISPCFSFSSLIQPVISFNYHMRGSQMGFLKLYISTDNGFSWKGVFDDIGNQGSNWQTGLIDLSTYAGEPTIRFRFRANTGIGDLSDIAIDRVRIVENAPRIANPNLAAELESNLTEAALAPNPTAGQSTVKVPEGFAGQVLLYDLSGKMITRHDVAEGQTSVELNLEELPNGIYPVLVQSASYRKALRLVKQ